MIKHCENLLHYQGDWIVKWRLKPSINMYEVRHIESVKCVHIQFVWRNIMESN